MNRAPVIWLCGEKLCMAEATVTFVDGEGRTVRLCAEHRAMLLAAAAIVGVDVAELKIVPVHS